MLPVKLIFTRLELVPRRLPPDAAVISDPSAARAVAKLGIQPVVEVNTPDVVSLEGVKASLGSRGFRTIVALGGWVASSAARALAVRKLKHLTLRESLFENPTQFTPVISVALDPSLCVPLSEIALIWDPIVPVYYALRIPLLEAWIPIDYCSLPELRERADYEVLRADAELLGVESPELNSCADVARFCRSYAARGPGPLLLASMSLAAVAGVQLREALEATLRALRGDCSDWLKRTARKELDLLAEHAWSYYSQHLSRLGARDSYGALSLFRRLLGSCLLT